jgi:iron complex outermembrane receptor protein
MQSFVRHSVAASAAAATVITTFLLGLPPGAQAQVSEIVVTTRKREESIQDIPIAVTPITSEQIERQGISDLADVAKLSPSLQFDTAYGPQDVRITVRGLSNTRGRSNVAFLVDGIDVTTENVISAGSGLLTNRRLLTDVERIEVVKGPQSALYGRAAFAGAISYITKEPGDEFEGRISADVADYGRQEFGAAFGGPVLGDLLGVRVTGVHWTQDGFYQNSISGEDVGSGEGYGTSLTAVFRPLDDMKWKARVAFSEEEYAPTATVRLQPDTLRPYPEEAITAGIGNAALLPFIGLFDHGLDGFPLPTTFGSASGKKVRLSENFRTGEDYPGDDIQVLQTSLVGSWDLGTVNLSSYTGYTEAEFKQMYDQDFQARGRPDTLLAHQETNMDQTTRQFSQELRLQTALDGPVQFTAGVLYWEEERDLYDNNFIIACLPLQVDLFSRELLAAPFVCDGTNGSVSSWQEYARQLKPSPATLLDFPELANYPGDSWSADTKSWSYYFMAEWQVLDKVKLTLENRLVVEEFDLRKPNHSGCTALGFDMGFGFSSPLLSEAANPGVDVLCESLNVIVNGYNPADPSQTRDFAYIQGTVSSRFHTPKVTLDWQINDDHLAYFSWARAQKPGGINQLVSGGSPVTIEDEFFDAEKMTAWELGLKSTLDARGTLVVNSAAFFQDYTDKQVTTQVVTELGLQPRVINASAAEVWGVEIEALWQPDAIDGLSLSIGYTWLDAEYTDFIQDTRSLARIAGAGSCEWVVLDGEDFCRLYYDGHKLERTPEHSLVTAASLRRPLGDSGFDWLAELSASYQDERFVDDDNFLKFDDYWLVDLRLGLASERTEIILYVDNLFDDDTLKSGGSGPDFGEQVTQLGFTAGLGVPHWFGTLPDPRLFGIRVNYRFGNQ